MIIGVKWGRKTTTDANSQDYESKQNQRFYLGTGDTFRQQLSKQLSLWAKRLDVRL